MSVLIKGMEMPKNCEVCPLNFYECAPLEKSSEEIMQYFGGDSRHPDCPLIEVQPHGRLIDADEFIKGHCNLCDGACENTYCDCLSCKETMRCDMIQDFSNAPTVIESEGE